MDNTQELFVKAVSLLKERYGTDFKFEDGDNFVFCLNNCTMVIAMKDKNLSVEFSSEEPFFMDMDCSLFTED